MENRSQELKRKRNNKIKAAYKKKRLQNKFTLDFIYHNLEETFFLTRGTLEKIIYGK